MALAPPVGRSTKQRTEALLAFAVAATAGGATTGIVLWLFSGLTEPLPSTVVQVVLVVGIAVALLIEGAGLEGRLPGARRQIPPSVFDRRPVDAAVRFGFELGTGVRTYMVAAAPVLLALTVLIGRPGVVGALATGAGFGVGRGVLPALRHGAGDPTAWDRRLASSALWLRIAGLSAVVGATLIVLRSLG